MAFFLGFDAGGTKTTCALADDTHVLARDVGGSIKPLRVSIEHARQNLAALLGEIAKQSGVDLGNISASCIGTAGVRLPQTDGWMRQILSQCAGGEIVVCGDEEIALDAAFPGGAGVLAMAGTGSNVMGRTSQGEMLNVGGWGPALGDQASGHWIGLASAALGMPRARLRTAHADSGSRDPVLVRGEPRRGCQHRQSHASAGFFSTRSPRC